MEKIQVLLSTYNGERYLREQLDSILKQDCEREGLAHMSLLVRDDGSSDGTVAILKEYGERYPEQFSWFAGENRGVIQSFFDLITRSEEDAEYFALADQDDVWMPDKLSSGLRCLRQMAEDGRPHLYCCRPKLVDEHLEPLVSDIKRPPMRPSFKNALVENIVTGCTAVINRTLRDLVREDIPSFTVMHDWWLYLLASCFGTVYYDETPHICYRQHGGNAVGSNSSRWSELKERISRFRGNRRNISRQMAEFVKIYGDVSHKKNLSPCRDDKNVEKCLHLAAELVESRHSFPKRLRLIRKGGIYRQRKTDHRIFMLILLSGSF